jgi:hypothetical protein
VSVGEDWLLDDRWLGICLSGLVGVWCWVGLAVACSGFWFELRMGVGMSAWVGSAWLVSVRLLRETLSWSARA